MGRFREFPYRGSLLRKIDGQVQEVFHEPISAKARPEPAPIGLGQPSGASALGVQGPLSTSARARMRAPALEQAGVLSALARTRSWVAPASAGLGTVRGALGLGLGMRVLCPTGPRARQVLVERMELVRHIVDEAARLAPERIAFHWQHACTVRGPPAPTLTLRLRRSAAPIAGSGRARRAPNPPHHT